MSVSHSRGTRGNLGRAKSFFVPGRKGHFNGTCLLKKPWRSAPNGFRELPEHKRK